MVIASLCLCPNDVVCMLLYMIYMLLYMIYIILCHSDHFLGILRLLFSIFFDLVYWHAVRFGAEGLSGSSLSIPRDRGKVCLHPTLPRPYK